MPRFFFHLRTGEDLDRDLEGLEFPSLEAAYLDAFRAATEIWTEMLANRQDPRDLTFQIHDSAGRLLLTLPFSEVLQTAKGIRPRAPPLTAHKVQSEVQRMHRLWDDLRVEIASARQVLQASKELLERARL